MKGLDSRRKEALIIFILVMFYIILVIQNYKLNDLNKTNNNVLLKMSHYLDLQIEVKQADQDIKEEIDSLKKQVESIVREQKAMRQSYDITGRGEKQVNKKVMVVTAYDLSYESCGKYPGHLEYGITASGQAVREWFTVAAGKSIPFGTQVYIPFFSNKPNKGLFTVTDRGGGVGDNQIDVYMKNYQDCMDFGRQKLEVWIIG